MNFIQVNKTLGIPKYRQIVSSIEQAITEGQLKKGDKLPSLNKIKIANNLSRDTVLMVFNELKNRGIVNSVVGKGYYVTSEDVTVSKKVFVLFDELNAFKEDLYNSLIKNLGRHVQVDIFFHHFNKKVFSQIIYENVGVYSHYVIMPANLKNTGEAISQIQADKVFLLDQVQAVHKNYPAVFQNFKKDVFRGLNEVADKLKSYKKLVLLFNEYKQPLGIKLGFEAFCKAQKLPFEIRTDRTGFTLNKGEAFMVSEDQQLIQIIKKIKEQNFKLAEDIGLISYNESMLKEVIEGGITTISTDFELMGQHLADMITNNTKSRIENSSRLTLRKSL
jgi:DNA-binding transcriptional regulator YhcF (GntR family)